MSTPIYFALFEILQKYLYGADCVLTGEMELVLTLISTILSIAVVLLPFILVFLFIRWCFG